MFNETGKLCLYTFVAIIKNFNNDKNKHKKTSKNKLKQMKKEQITRGGRPRTPGITSDKKCYTKIKIASCLNDCQVPPKKEREF